MKTCECSGHGLWYCIFSGGSHGIAGFKVCKFHSNGKPYEVSHACLLCRMSGVLANLSAYMHTLIKTVLFNYSTQGSASAPKGLTVKIRIQSTQRSPNVTYLDIVIGHWWWWWWWYQITCPSFWGGIMRCYCMHYGTSIELKVSWFYHWSLSIVWEKTQNNWLIDIILVAEDLANTASSDFVSLCLQHELCWMHRLAFLTGWLCQKSIKKQDQANANVWVQTCAGTH